MASTSLEVNPLTIPCHKRTPRLHCQSLRQASQCDASCPCRPFSSRRLHTEHFFFFDTRCTHMLTTHNRKPHNPTNRTGGGGPLCQAWRRRRCLCCVPLRETQGPAHDVPRGGHSYTMTPLQMQMPWTQPKPMLPLDVLDSCNSTQVGHLHAGDVCVSVWRPVSFVSPERLCVKPCARLGSVSPNASHPT